LVLFFGAGLVLVVHASPSSLVGMIFNSWLMRFFGKYSYGIYETPQ
jgi:peptidoglycan/LPS O-acetylase OafA/YrhL